MNVQNLVTTKEAQDGFYPTPPNLSAQLLSGIEWDVVENILEPSAGKGNLIWAIAEKYNVHAIKGSNQKIGVDCIEIDAYLRSILQYEFCGQRQAEIQEQLGRLEKKQKYDSQLRRFSGLTAGETDEYKKLTKGNRLLHRLNLHIVHDDFLTFQSRKQYSLIVMNPPFSNGDAHLLKAIELQQRNGGLIRCILNAETIRNPYTNRRRLLTGKLNELGAEIKYVDRAFSNSERQTDVTAAIIKINIPVPKRESVIFNRLRQAAKLEESVPPDVTEITVADFMEQIVSRFNVETDAGIELIQEYIAMEPYILESFEKEYGNNPILSMCVGDSHHSLHSFPNVNEYIRRVRGKYWAALFSNKEFVGKLTSNLRQKYREIVNRMLDYDFTLYNIQCIAEQMDAEMGKGIQDTIIALFDKLTQEHSWYPECQKNIHYYSGWKTNKAHKINSKVILPVSGMFSDYSWSKTFEVREAEAIISDIEKVFDYLDGNETTPVDLSGTLKQACESGKTRNIYCKYFDVTLYKKGTMHIKFRNQALVDRFNIYCCRKKNWLPPSYGKSTYAEMNEAEREVVDSFHGNGSQGTGKSGYQEVMLKASYFLAEPVKQMPMLVSSKAEY